MNLKKKLITSGCSFTSGYRLTDPTKAWPHILGQKLNLPVENVAHEGMGNDYIFSSAVEIADTDSLIILGLTAYSRVEFINAVTEKIFTTIPNRRGETEFDKLFWQDHYDEKYYYNKFRIQLELWNAYLTKNKISYYMFDALPMNHYGKINISNYLWCGEKNMCDITYPHKLHDGHPDEIAHEIMAEELYKIILDRL